MVWPLCLELSACQCGGDNSTVPTRDKLSLTIFLDSHWATDKLFCISHDPNDYLKAQIICSMICHLYLNADYVNKTCFGAHGSTDTFFSVHQPIMIHFSNDIEQAA